ncbi:MAG: hypothetical protein KJ630_05895 [Proteobacteria bacterium]|nr:hypothetical protein [Pseudomonadota bacterium]
MKKERNILWEQEFETNKKIKSNTPIVFIPTIIMFVILAMIDIYTNIPKEIYRALFFVMFGYLFIGVSIAQIRSGYLWKNLKKGNRGKHKSDSPGEYILSIIFYTIIGLCFWCYVAYAYFSK